jgi:hypothetical protein
MPRRNTGVSSRRDRVLTFGDSCFAHVLAVMVASSASFARQGTRKTMPDVFARKLISVRTLDARTGALDEKEKDL